MRTRFIILILIILALFALQIAVFRSAHAGYNDNTVIDNTIRKTIDSLHFHDNIKGKGDSIR